MTKKGLFNMYICDKNIISGFEFIQTCFDVSKVIGDDKVYHLKDIDAYCITRDNFLGIILSDFENEEDVETGMSLAVCKMDIKVYTTQIKKVPASKRITSIIRFFDRKHDNRYSDLYSREDIPSDDGTPVKNFYVRVIVVTSKKKSITTNRIVCFSHGITKFPTNYLHRLAPKIEIITQEEIDIRSYDKSWISSIQTQSRCVMMNMYGVSTGDIVKITSVDCNNIESVKWVRVASDNKK